MKRKQAREPYSKYWLYGPVMHKTEKRRFVFLINKSDCRKRTTLSLARYLMAVNLGRKLKKSECVDHIDGKKTNDTIKNLQILTRRENSQKHTKQAKITRVMLKMMCPNCNKVFVIRKNKSFMSKGGKFNSCSRECCGILRRKMQLGQQVDLSNNVLGEYSELSYP